MSGLDANLPFSWLSADEAATLEELAARDWRTESLTLGDERHEQLAADAVALGAVACHGFGNMYVLSAHPSQPVARYVNQVAGRSADFVSSITTTGEHLSGLFDFTRLPRA